MPVRKKIECLQLPLLLFANTCQPKRAFVRLKSILAQILLPSLDPCTWVDAYSLSNFHGSITDRVPGQFKFTLPSWWSCVLIAIKRRSAMILQFWAKRRFTICLTLDGPTMKCPIYNLCINRILSRFSSLTTERIDVFPDFQHVIAVFDDAKPNAAKMSWTYATCQEWECVNFEWLEAFIRNGYLDHLLGDGVWQQIDSYQGAYDRLYNPNKKNTIQKRLLRTIRAY